MTHTYYNIIPIRCRHILVLLLTLMAWSPATAFAAEDTDTDSTRVFTDTHPLVYEDAWDLWPYSFLNEYGEPVGYNIDLLTLIFDELKIPFVIKLKATSDALKDLKAGRSDLMLDMEAAFHNDYGSYGKSVIQIFTHSLVHRKSEEPKVLRVNDLAHNRVIVHDGSFSHYLMKRRGWANNAIPYNDMQEAIQLVHNEPDYQILWNTLSLKWLIHKFNYNDLELTPVRIQNGEYKFMSNNPELLQKLDSVFAKLNAEGQLQSIQNKWFYPERRETGIPSWVWKAVILLMALTLFILTYYLIYRRYEKRVTKDLRRSNDQLAVILKTSHIRVWVFHASTKTITVIDENGIPQTEELAPSTFFNSVRSEDFRRIMQAFQDIVKKKDSQASLVVQSHDGPEGVQRTQVVVLSVLHRDKDGKPSDIMGTTSDITEEQQRQQEAKDTMLRYQSVFDSALIDTVAYDEHGIITDMSQKARMAFSGNFSNVLSQKISIQDVLGMDDFSVEDMEYTYLTQIFSRNDQRALMRFLKRDELIYELQLVPVRDDSGHLLGIFGSGRDMTDVAKSYALEQENIRRMQEANKEQEDYIRNIDFVLKNGGVRMVSYSPDTHTLTIYGEIGHELYQLTQTRGLGLVDESSKKMVRRLLNSMDYRSHAPIKAVVKTTIRLKGNKMLYLYVSFVPTYDAEGRVKSYFGMFRDISEIKALEEHLAKESVKAQELETVKNAFLRNMSYEIRTPLSSVVGFAELFDMEHTEEDEKFFINEINKNSAKLLELINDILFLSRLDAGMIEIKKEPIDFAVIFESKCETAWFNNKQPNVSYIADNPYHQLVVEIDQQNLGIVIGHIVANAAQNTKSGQVHASYDYTGEELVMFFQDTGCGIPPSTLEHIFDRFVTDHAQNSGLGLSICHEIVRKMGGSIRIKSEVNKGTIVWVSIPCKCSEIVRK